MSEETGGHLKVCACFSVIKAVQNEATKLSDYTFDLHVTYNETICDNNGWWTGRLLYGVA